MRSSLLIPALAFLALALAGCEVQPVVSNIAPPPAVQAETPAAETTMAKTTVAETTVAETTVAETTVAKTTVAKTTVAETTLAESNDAENGSETGGGAGVPEILSEAEPETTIEETYAVADTAAEQDDAAAGTADKGQADFTEPEAAPAIPAATAVDSAEVAGKVASVAQTGAGEQADEELPQTGDLAMAAPPPAPPPPPPGLAPSSLVGSSVPMLRSRLGEADFTRTEGEVETWQYRFETCVVDYFLVADSNAARVVSWAWRAPVIGAQVDETACRRALAGRDSAS